MLSVMRFSEDRTRMPSMTSAEPQRKSKTESSFSRFVRRLGPYPSLALLLVPLSVVEPLKLIAVAVAGEGHWIAGTAMVAGAYAVSVLFIERLFRLVKPKLLTLHWFARLWRWFVGLRGKLSSWLIPSLAAPPTAKPNRRAAKRDEQ
jgi:hypothetical protein